MGGKAAKTGSAFLRPPGGLQRASEAHGGHMASPYLGHLLDVSDSPHLWIQLSAGFSIRKGSRNRSLWIVRAALMGKCKRGLQDIPSLAVREVEGSCRKSFQVYLNLPFLNPKQ